MSLIAWDDKFSVGIREFDDAHKRLMELLNQLWDANEARHGAEVLGRILDELITYTAGHFAEEEALFRAWNYPVLHRHHDLHEKLKATVLDLKGKFGRDGAAVISDEAFDFLRDWLVKHILGEDMLYKSYFNSLGIHSVRDAPAAAAHQRGGSGRVLPAATAAALAGGLALGTAGALTGGTALTWGGLGLTAAGLGLFVMFAVGLLGPLAQLTEILGRLALGDLEVEVPQGGAGPIGRIARLLRVLKANTGELRRQTREIDSLMRKAEAERRQSLLEMSDTLESVVGESVTEIIGRANQMRESARSMHTQADDVRLRSDAVAGDAGDATESVRTVAASAEDLSRSIHAIERQVMESSGIAASAVEEATRTGDIVRALSESSERISQVVQLINSIAGQTNLLALNATIEAARAGEAGKGFAVVANEVKNLANQTGKATEDITRQIAAIQQVVADAVGAIGGIGTTIGQIHRIAGTVSDAVATQKAATGAIAERAQVAASGTSRVLDSIGVVSSTSREAGSMSAQVLNDANQVADEIERLRTRLIETLRNSSAGDRREHQRVAAGLATVVDDQGRRVSTHLKDVSMGGALLEVKLDVPRGERLTLTLENEPGTFPGEVVAVSPKGTHIKFLLDAAARARLRGLVERLVRGSVHQAASGLGGLH
ncbi:bacteriohemerythrin [Azospirillum halopraeferens]|uniref:bacteriohemerythrin n=1 Tax=Azospirillum halopraeferens TaxID=34010 RepID=UPI0003FB37E5|nr:bacteriohemerythrin [Azospirillum halopraeferens]